jgi:hypothetical protein
MRSRRPNPNPNPGNGGPWEWRTLGVAGPNPFWKRTEHRANIQHKHKIACYMLVNKTTRINLAPYWSYTFRIKRHNTVTQRKFANIVSRSYRIKPRQRTLSCWFHEPVSQASASTYWQNVRSALPVHGTKRNRGYKQNSIQIAHLLLKFFYHLVLQEPSWNHQRNRLILKAGDHLMLSRPFNTVKRNYRLLVDRDIYFKLNAASNSLKLQESESDPHCSQYCYRSHSFEVGLFKLIISQSSCTSTWLSSACSLILLLVRGVTNTSKFHHINPILKSLHWLKISERIRYKILSITCKCLP